MSHHTVSDDPMRGQMLIDTAAITVAGEEATAEGQSGFAVAKMLPEKLLQEGSVCRRGFRDDSMVLPGPTTHLLTPVAGLVMLPKGEAKRQEAVSRVSQAPKLQGTAACTRKCLGTAVCRATPLCRGGSP